MNYEHLSAWGTFLSGLGTLFVACIGLLIIVLDVRLRLHQLRESKARSGAVMSMNVESIVLPFTDKATVGESWVLETRITIKNCGHEAWCVAALYVRTRALFDGLTSAAEARSRIHESDVDQLPACGTLSKVRNLARHPYTIIHIAPDEEETFVRWDVVDRKFIDEHPVIVTQVDAFTMPVALIGAGYTYTTTIGPFRDKWLNFMNGPERTDMARHQELIFGRAEKDYEDSLIKRGDRVLLIPGSSTVDEDNSVKFREPLKATWGYSRSHTVSLAAMTKRSG